ncbi:MAG: response regulator [Candidatus Eisenbacteria bacterium]|nr:response regulator [Candidatus Eisenbacteria bacterium]
MSTAAPRLEICPAALLGVAPFLMHVDSHHRIRWASPAILRRIPDAVGRPLQEVLKAPDAESFDEIRPHASHEGGIVHALLRSSGKPVDLVGSWVPCGAGFLLLAHPEIASADQLGELSFDDLREEDARVDLLSMRDELSASLSEASEAIHRLKEQNAQLDGWKQRLEEANRRLQQEATERERVAAKLRSLNELQHITLSASVAAAFTVDPERRITSINEEFCRITGRTGEEVLGQDCRVLDGVNCQKYCALFDPERREPIRKKECTILTKDGRRLTVLKSAELIRDEQENITMGVESFVDVTDLIASREEAQRANRTKSEFLANMSHEIRTPMNGIIGMTQLALDTQLSPEQQEYLGIVRNSAETLLDLLNDILDFSKIEAGKIDFEEIDFSLRDTLGDALQTLATRAHEMGLELSSDIHADVPDALRGDPTRLRQVIVNLVGNAIKFTEEGEVTVRVTALNSDEIHDDESETEGREGTQEKATRAAEDVANTVASEAPPSHPAVPDRRSSATPIHLHFAIRDTGIGISREHQERIFRAFSQADSSTTRRFGGTGLGLAISSQLVTLMGGRIWLESEVDVGSTFHFRTVFRPGVRKTDDCAKRQSEALRGLSALIVDDNATNRRVFEEMLRSWQMQPVSASSAEEALAMLWQSSDRPQRPRLMLLDAMMPGMDGYELAARVRQVPEFADLRILMLSSAGQAADADRRRECDISGFILKPVKQSDLLSAICQAMEEYVPECTADDDEASEEPHTGPDPAAAEPSSHEGDGAAASPDESDGAAASSDEGDGAAQTAQSRMRILLVEDNPVNQKVAMSLLQKQGHAITVAENGRQALVRLEEDEFDIVLMDVQMPEMDGYEATAAIRKREDGGDTHIPIIAMTARALRGDRERCLAAGMDDYLPKPIRPAALLQILERYAPASVAIKGAGEAKST